MDSFDKIKILFMFTVLHFNINLFLSSVVDTELLLIDSGDGTCFLLFFTKESGVRGRAHKLNTRFSGEEDNGFDIGNSVLEHTDSMDAEDGDVVVIESW